jgi:hypothetical protein
LKRLFGSEKFDAKGMLKKLAKGKPIAKGSLEDVEALIIDLEASSIWPGKRVRRPFSSRRAYTEIY